MIRFILLFFLYSFSANNNVLPTEEITYISIEKATRFLTIYRPSDNKRYRIGTGVGCIRALLDPLDNIELELEGFGDFSPGRKDNYPNLNIRTKYRKTSCKVLWVDSDIVN